MSRPLASRAWLAAPALALLALSGSARAGVEDIVGLGPRDTALGGSYVARPGDFAAAYYNPAGLAPGGAVKEHGGFFELTVAAVWARPFVHADRTGGGPVATPGTPDTAGALLGARFSAGQMFDLDGLDAGLALYLPAHIFRWTIAPDDDPQWAMLTDRSQVLSFDAGLAYRVTRWLSVGVGARALFDVQTVTTGSVTSVQQAKDPATGNDVLLAHTRLGTDAQVFGRITPQAGLLVTPIDAVRVGFAWRAQSYVDDWGYTRIAGVPGLGNLGYSHHFAHYFHPTELALGASWDVTRTLDVSADLTWNRWSAALSTNRNDLGAVQFGDTWTPALGARLRLGPSASVMAGYRFYRSPLDNFGGPTNLLDNDRHVTSVGGDLDLGKLVCECLQGAKLVAAVQPTLLVSRTDTKDFRRFRSDVDWMNNAGYPGVTWGGWMLGASVGVEAKW